MCILIAIYLACFVSLTRRFIASFRGHPKRPVLKLNAVMRGSYFTGRPHRISSGFVEFPRIPSCRSNLAHFSGSADSRTHTVPETSFIRSFRLFVNLFFDFVRGNKIELYGLTSRKHVYSTVVYLGETQRRNLKISDEI